MLSILPVDRPSREKQFLELPRLLYCDDPCWIGEPESQVRGLSGMDAHGFYADASCQAFLAVKNDEPVGRIVAIHHHLYANWNADSVGYFGFFESVNDQAVATALLEAVEAWLRQQQVSRVRGPVNPSLNYSCGCLANQFDVSPTAGMPYNPSWYSTLIQTSGYKAVRDLLSFCGDIEMLNSIDPRVKQTAIQARDRFGIQLRHFRMDNFESDLDVYFEIFNQTIPQHWGAVPVTRAEIGSLIEDYRCTTAARFTAIAEHQGKPIGTVYGLPDINPLIHNRGWDVLQEDWVNQPDYRSQIKRIRISTTLVLPQYNLWGIGPLMNWFLLEQALSDPDWNATLSEVEYSWILDNNRLSRGTIERGGAHHDKTHRLFEKPL